MAILKNPNEIATAFKPAILIYGQPGTGKTTLALSAPNPVLIDADKGMHRVEKRFQTISLPLNDYRDLLALFAGNELDPFETIVFDTLGKLLDRMTDHIIRENPKMGNGKGGLQMQGWGALKVEFQNLLKLGQSKGKILVFVAHEKEEKDGDTRIVRPDAAGSSGKDLMKDLDLMGYIEVRNNKRTISFNPSEKFYAKNSLRLPDVIEIPDTANGNHFIQTFILDKAVERMKADDIEGEKYTALLANLMTVVNLVTDAKTADEALATIGMSPVIWDSQRVAKAKLNDKIRSIGLAYDRETKSFKPAPAAQPEQKAEPAAEEKQPSGWDKSVNDLIDAMKACANVTALNALLKKENEAINLVTLQADEANRKKLADAINGRRAELTKTKAA